MKIPVVSGFLPFFFFLYNGEGRIRASGWDLVVAVIILPIICYYCGRKGSR